MFYEFLAHPGLYHTSDDVNKLLQLYFTISDSILHFGE